MLRDYLNYGTRSELRTYVLAHGQAVAILGDTTLGDIPQETWYYDETSLAEDDGLTVMKPDELLETDPGRFLINMVQADYGNLFNKPAFAEVAMTGSYNDLTDKVSTGMGLMMSGNEIAVDESEIMTVGAATSAIADMETQINSKTPQTRTITINGVTQTLAANRDWEVGDISSAGSYANPTWITSLAYSKLTGAPTIPAAQVNSDWTASSGVAQILNKPTIPSTTTQITEGTNQYFTNARARAAISLTTTGTGAASYNSSTGALNIPMPSTVLKEYVGAATVSGGAGNVIFYLTSDGTSTGTALFTTVSYANPFVNDSVVNYSYGWTYNATTKALTVNVKSAAGLYISLLNLSLLGVPANVANGTSVSVLVKGT